MKDKTTIVVGPPGTGKTTALLSIVEEKIESGIDPCLIGFFAFTKKAADEASTRASKKFGLTVDAFPYFRTLHSLAFRELGLKRNDVMGPSDYIEIAKSLGIFITFRGIEEGSSVGMSKGDRLLFTDNLARVRGVSLRDQFESMFDENFSFDELDQFSRTLSAYKEDYEKVDYTDMIVRYVSEGTLPNIRILIIDEAQDLSPIQWIMVARLATVSREVYVAGDDDQAIYNWAGADAAAFISLEGIKTRTLNYSFRVPSDIARLSLSVIERVRERREKTWHPRSDSRGRVDRVNSIHEVDMSKGEWLLLARNVFLLKQFNEYCRSQGYFFQTPVEPPIRKDIMRAIVSWENLRQGKKALASDVSCVLSLMKTRGKLRHGAKAEIERLGEDEFLTIHDLKIQYGLKIDSIWHEALEMITREERDYIVSARRRGERLLAEPRIRVSTIHSIKGGEADNVVLLTDMAAKTYHEYENRPDDEYRVWYVAMTRARERLVIVSPSTSMFFPI